MLIDMYTKNGYRILDIKDNISIHTNLDELVTMVEVALRQCEKNIAFSFTKDSFLFSESIRSIMVCFELIKENNGSLAIIQPNEDIQSLIKVLGLDTIIKVFPSKEAFLNRAE